MYAKALSERVWHSVKVEGATVVEQVHETKTKNFEELNFDYNNAIATTCAIDNDKVDLFCLNEQKKEKKTKTQQIPIIELPTITPGEPELPPWFYSDYKRYVGITANNFISMPKVPV